MTNEVINFRSERERHGELLERKDVLEELDRLLGLGGGTRGWVLIKGGPGLGKSALLAHYLARLERAGQRLPHHFLRRGVQGWDRPEVVARNLAAQVEALFPEQTLPDARPETRLQEGLQRVSDEVLVPRGERLLIVIDGLDEAEPVVGGLNPLPYFLPEVLPQGVHVLCASRPTYPYLSWLEARDSVRRIDLDDERWAASNEQVVRRYWEQAALRTEPPLEPSLIAEAVHQARGNILYTLKLFDWLQHQPPARRRAELLPHGLEAFLVEVWQRLLALPEHERTVALTGLGLIAAAREALPQSVLAAIAGWRDVATADRFLRATRPFLLEEPEHWGSERALRPFHESFREFILRRLGVEGMRREHRRLAEHLCTWPVEAVVQDFRRRYALRHGVVHWLEAGDWQWARSLCTDVGYLEAKCREVEVSAVEEDLSRATRVTQGDDQEFLRKLLQAVRVGSHRLREDPGALAQLVYNWFRCLGWTGDQLKESLSFPEGLPALRLRHPVKLSGNGMRILPGHLSWVNACTVLPDGRRALSASSDSTLQLWDLETGRTLAKLEGHWSCVNACAVLPDGRRALSASGDDTLRLWDLETGRTLVTLVGHSHIVSACAVLPDGRRALSASNDNTLRLWDLETGHTLATLVGHSYRVNSCAVSPDGRRALSASFDGTLRLWDLETARTLATLVGHSRNVRACAMLPDGRRALSASDDRTLRLWDLETGHTLATLEGHSGCVNACAVLPDGRRALSASNDNTLKLWDLETGDALATLMGHSAWVRACAVLPDGRRALSASNDRTLRLWDLERTITLSALEGHSNDVAACAVLPDGQRALSASNDRTLRLWDLETGRALATLVGHSDEVSACAVLPDGQRALSASHDRTLRLWDLETGRALATLVGHSHIVRACAVLPDGRRALSASFDRTLRLWDLETGHTLDMLVGHSDCVNACAVLPDGRRALSASDDRTLRLWDLETGHTLATLVGHSGCVSACAVLPDGQRALSASKDTTLKLWDLQTGRALATLVGHSDNVNACAVLPDGRRALSASDDDTLKLWDLHTGACLLTLYGSAPFLGVSITGSVICAGDSHGNVWMLEAHSKKPCLSPTTSSPRLDLGIVIALKEEFRVFRELLPTGLRPERDETTGQYDYTFELPGAPHRCVVSFIGEMNPENAALHTERLLSRWNPRTVVMLGIAAGLHPDVRVGDVVVASQVDNYLASARAVPGKPPGSHEFSLSGTVFQGDHDFLSRVRNLEFTQGEAFLSWRQQCQAAVACNVPEGVRAKLPCQSLLRPEPELLDVHLASGPVVGAAKEFTRWLRARRNRNLKALDMESAGLMAAAFKRAEPTRTLVLRGISDYGDERKSTLDAVGEGALRRQAMHNATTLLWTLLRTSVLPSSGG